MYTKAKQKLTEITND